MPRTHRARSLGPAPTSLNASPPPGLNAPPLSCDQNPKNRLDLHEGKDGTVYVKGLNTFVVKGEAEIAAVLEVGVAAPSSLALRRTPYLLHSFLGRGTHHATSV